MNLKERIEKLASLKSSAVDEEIKDFDSMDKCALNLALKDGEWSANTKVRDFLKDNVEDVAKSIYTYSVIPFLLNSISKNVKADNAETIFKTIAAIIKVVHDEENLAEIQLSDIVNKNSSEGLKLFFGNSRFSDNLKYYDKTKKIIEQKIFAGVEDGLKIGVHILFVPQVPQKPKRDSIYFEDLKVPDNSNYSDTFGANVSIVADNAVYYTIFVSKDYEEYRENNKWQLEVFLSRLLTEGLFTECNTVDNKIIFKKNAWIKPSCTMSVCANGNYSISREMGVNILSGIVLSEALDISDRKFVEILKDFYKENYKYDIKYTREADKRYGYVRINGSNKNVDDIDDILADGSSEEEKEDMEFFEYKFKLICAIIDMYYGINQ